MTAAASAGAAPGRGRARTTAPSGSPARSPRSTAVPVRTCAGARRRCRSSRAGAALSTARPARRRLPRARHRTGYGRPPAARPAPAAPGAAATAGRPARSCSGQWPRSPAGTACPAGTGRFRRS
ncbi:hypothetical protein G6F59_016691 [Rhizopus arrhizus]|nr:hypothetical protein G6F59_016691 [Rhizopus arrhizus]